MRPPRGPNILPSRRSRILACLKLANPEGMSSQTISQITGIPPRLVTEALTKLRLADRIAALNEPPIGELVMWRRTTNPARKNVVSLRAQILAVLATAPPTGMTSRDIALKVGREQRGVTTCLSSLKCDGKVTQVSEPSAHWEAALWGLADPTKEILVGRAVQRPIRLAAGDHRFALLMAGLKFEDVVFRTPTTPRSTAG